MLRCMEAQEELTARGEIAALEESMLWLLQVTVNSSNCLVASTTCCRRMTKWTACATTAGWAR